MCTECGHVALPGHSCPPTESGRVPSVFTGQVPVGTPEWPECRGHRERQHRDGKPPWCHQCGWTRGTAATPPLKCGTPNGGWGTP